MIHITSTVKTLRDMMKPVGAIADECRLNISPEGLSVKVVDPANIAMIGLDLPKDVFFLYTQHEIDAQRESFKRGYVVDESLEVGLDVVNYLSLFEGAEDNETAELIIEPYEDGKHTHRLILKISGIFEQTLTLMKPDEVRMNPNIPTFTLRAQVEVSKEFLKRCFDMAAKAGDYIRMQAIDKPHIRPLFAMECGEETRKFKVELTTGVEITAESPEIRLKSTFSLDYLCDMVNAIGKGVIIKMRLDKDYPLKLDFKVLDHGQASFMMAPRVESE